MIRSWTGCKLGFGCDARIGSWRGANLQAIGARNELVVTWVRPNPLLVHQMNACNGDGEDGAAAALAEEAGGRSLALLAHSAEWEVALAAFVVVHAIVVPGRGWQAWARRWLGGAWNAR